MIALTSADLSSLWPLWVGILALVIIIAGSILTAYMMEKKGSVVERRIKEESSTIRVVRFDFSKDRVRYFNLKDIAGVKETDIGTFLQSFPSREGLKVRNWAEDLFKGNADSEFLECDVYMKRSKKIAPSFLRAIHVDSKKKILLVESYLLRSNVLKSHAGKRHPDSPSDFATRLKQDNSPNGATFCFAYSVRGKSLSSESNAISERVINCLWRFVLGNQLLIKRSKNRFIVCNFDMYDATQALNYALEVCTAANRELRAKRKKGQGEITLKCGIVMNGDVLKNADLLIGQAMAAADKALEGRDTVHIYKKGEALSNEAEFGTTFRTEVERIIYGKRIGYSYRPIVSLNMTRIVGYLGKAEPLNTAFGSMDELINYAERANDIKTLLNAVVNEMAKPYLSDRPLKSQSLYIPIKMHQVDFVLAALMRATKNQTAPIYVLIDDAEAAKSLSPLKTDTFIDTLANIKKGGFRIAFLISGEGTLLSQKVYSQADSFIVSFSGADTGLSIDTRVRSGLHAMAEKLLKYKKPIIASGLENFSAIELVHSDGIDYVSSDALAPYADKFYPLGEKTVEKLKDLKGREHHG